MKRMILVGVFCLLTSSYTLAEVESFVPQVVAGGKFESAFRTVFHLVNLSDNTITGQIQAIRNDGKPMEVFSSNRPIDRWTDIAIFSLPAFGQRSVFALGDFPTQVGWATIRSSAPVAIVVTLGLFQSNRPVTSTSILPEPLLQGFTSYALVSPGAATGLALLNPSETEVARVTLKLIDKEGIAVGEKSITIQPRGKIAQFLNENELFTELKEFEGTFEVASSLPLAVAVIRVDDTYWSTFRAFPSRARVN